jgi:hypothetical protein
LMCVSKYFEFEVVPMIEWLYGINKSKGPYKILRSTVETQLNDILKP